MFNQVVFHAFGAPVSVAELLGFITGLWCVYLCAVQHIWNFPIGIANAIFFFILFQDAHLFADSWLQVVFAALLVLGWVAWLKGGPQRTELDAQWSSPKLLALTAVAIAIGTYLLIPILRDAHGAYPFWDALTTSLSIAAQFLLSLKRIENWFIWIAADLMYIPLYATKHLYLTSLVYVGFLSLCCVALFLWVRKEPDPNVLTA